MRYASIVWRIALHPLLVSVATLTLKTSYRLAPQDLNRCVPGLSCSVSSLTLFAFRSRPEHSRPYTAWRRKVEIVVLRVYHPLRISGASLILKASALLWLVRILPVYYEGCSLTPASLALFRPPCTVCVPRSVLKTSILLLPVSNVRYVQSFRCSRSRLFWVRLVLLFEFFSSLTT